MKKSKKWKPKIGEVYYFVYADEWVVGMQWDFHCEAQTPPGLIFKTKREAEAVARKIKKLLKESVK
jgi:hypothetical protein